ncbi:hypothetical protein DSM101010T_27150 [Desulfovibrio subterraneus]|uniref:Uncharacterized protein n=1 Tax=Desulfovibrio subterraneus TaxID=2718620 RepID=A0A7J0BL10_9BACT|nr:hypothetical protein DSM101010T_27150 [Desulfovibrio subterraneus]
MYAEDDKQHHKSSHGKYENRNQHSITTCQPLKRACTGIRRHPQRFGQKEHPSPARNPESMQVDIYAILQRQRFQQPSCFLKQCIRSLQMDTIELSDIVIHKVQINQSFRPVCHSNEMIPRQHDNIEQGSAFHSVNAGRVCTSAKSSDLTITIPCQQQRAEKQKKDQTKCDVQE